MNKQLETMLGKVAKYNPSANLDKIRAAYECAEQAHCGQLRKCGEPYIIHPIAVAKIIVDMRLDTDSIIAALLHDTLEDTELSREEISKAFGADVLMLVEGVTKLGKMTYSSKEEEEMENLRKMFLAMAKDLRVILIKLADRLHNMRTIRHLAENRRRELALETMEIYAPLAHRLGMQKIRVELEDLCLHELDPVAYDEIVENLKRTSQTHTKFLEHIKEKIRRGLLIHGISCRVDGRIKHVYSIYRKMFMQHKAFDEVYDIYAVRVIVDTNNDCYNVLGYIHDMFTPVLGRVKDYIGMPKPNMYQSLHTTVMGREGGIPFEIQIRTYEMHRVSEYGIAAHWEYKQGLAHNNKNTDRFTWVRQILESQQDLDMEDFIRSIKTEVLSDEVFVFTPRGDVINLPEGGTPVDFAYSIHSAIGNKMTGAKVNGKLVPFDTPLENGDVVEIQTSGAASGPKLDWLKICKTGEARNKIRQWFKKEHRDENIHRGKEELERELRRGGITLAEFTSESVLPVVISRFSYKTYEDMLVGIGYGGISAQRLINRAKEEITKQARTKLTPDQTVSALIIPTERKKTSSHDGVIVEDIGGCLVKFSRCCTPVPGDPVVGFVTRGHGVSVHRADCVNASPAFNKDDPNFDRWVPVRWADGPKDKFHTSLQIHARDRIGLLADMATLLSTLRVSIVSMNARETPDGSGIINITLEVGNLTQLNEVTSRISKIAGVTSIARGAF